MISFLKGKRLFKEFVIALTFLSLFVISCSTVPITGRSQLILISEFQEIQLGLQAYNQVLEKEEPSMNKRYVEYVNDVGNRIALQTEKNYQWEFNVFQGDIINAWCLPGGKIAFYDGILNIMDNEAQVATVMAHEIAHATARHGGERVSLGILAQVGAVAVQIAMRDKDPAIQYAVFQAYLPTVLVGVILPYSRKHENEADRMGLTYMARAGFNPEEALIFWEAMYEATKSKKRPPVWLSTHPTTLQRIENIKALLPEALEIYNDSDKAPNRKIR
tara:strand:- start:331 stop:1155 length:825 start_codon:yes stop_codon:yes gene_type:complete